MHKHFIFGKFIETENLITAQEAASVLDSARRARGSMAYVGIDEIIEILHKTGTKWLNKNYHLRERAVKVMPGVTGFSPSMVKEAIDLMGQGLLEANLKKNIRLQLRDRYLLDKFVFQPKTQSYLKLQSLGIVLHVSAGNVFAGPIDSLVQGILTKNVNILKLSSRDPVFPLLFLESLNETDKDGKITSNIAAIAFRGGERDVEDALKNRCDAIMLWGGDETITSYRQNLPNNVKLIEYGPKISFAVLTNEGLRKSNTRALASSVAKDIVMWEQRACSSPQFIYAEVGDEKLLERFTEELGAALENMKKQYPPGKLTNDEKVEMTKIKLLSKMDEAFGESVVIDSGRDLSWTIVLEKKEPEFERYSPLNRFIYIKPYESLDSLIDNVKKMRYYLQSCAIVSNPREYRYLVSGLTNAGVNRFTEPGKMWQGKPGSPHDGKFELEQPVKWVNIESSPVRFDLITNMQNEEIRKPDLLNAIGEIFDFAKKFSPFYKSFYKNAPLKNWDDFYKLPLTDKNHLYKNTPPRKNRLLTGELSESYIFSSGGTTGDPKFSFYTYDEFEEVTDILMRTYLSAGVTNKDTVANLFLAGNLWASFMAVNEALEKTGCVTMPISGNSDMNLIINFLASFKANVIMGLPSIILGLANHVEVNKIKNIKIEKILYGGEHFSVEAKKYLKKVLGADIIRSAGYASVDAGPVGFQCMESRGTIHHVFCDYIYLQIINPETRKPVPQGETGEIVVTLLKRKFMPLIKYRTGDLGRIIPGVCACGRDDVRFELLGRCDDIMRVGTVSIYPQEFAASFSSFKELSHIYQIIAGSKAGKDTLTLKIELKSGKTVGANGVRPSKSNVPLAKTAWTQRVAPLSRKVREKILEDDPELEEAVREKWLAEFTVEVLAPNAIPRTGAGGKGKVKHVVDKRKIK